MRLTVYSSQENQELLLAAGVIACRNCGGAAGRITPCHILAKYRKVYAVLKHLNCETWMAAFLGGATAM